MSKEKDTIIYTGLTKPVITWDTAIKDAETQIEEAKAKIKRLRQAIRSLELLRDKGEPFPGQNLKQSGAKV